jgi:hypothetical protein
MAMDPVEELAAIDRFRETLPDWRQGWFDSLQIRDQARLACSQDSDSQSEFGAANSEKAVH